MPLYAPSPNSGSGSAGTPGGAAAQTTTQVGGVNAGNLVTLAVDASGNANIDLHDGSGNTIGSTSGALNVNATQATGTNLHAVLDSLPSPTDITTSGTIVALNGSVTLVTHGIASAIITLTGTWTASIQIQGLAADGATWVNLSTALTPSGNTFGTGVIAANGTYRILTGSSYTSLRATATAYTSGTVNVGIVASQAPSVVQVIQLNAANLNAQVLTPDTSGSGTITALNTAVTLTPNGSSNVFANISGTWVATLTIEGQAGDGNWFGIDATSEASGTVISSTSVNTQLFIPVGGYSQVRVRASAYTSGTATVAWNMSAGFSALEVFQNNPIELQTSSFNTGSCLSNKLYMFSTDFNLPTNGTETVAIFLKNPSGSGKIYSLRYLTVATNGTTGQDAILRMYFNPTTSANGSAVTVSSCNIGGGASAGTATPFTGPTVSANGTRFNVINVVQGNSGAPVEHELDGRFSLNPNNTILITGQPSANNLSIAVSLVWAEL